MNCKYCGTQLRDDANFCSNCGKPQREDITGGIEENPRLVTCEIKYRVVKKGGILSKPIICWMADAYGPNGNYVAAVSGEFVGEHFKYDDLPPHLNDEDAAKAKDALTKLEDKLLNDGWDFVGSFGREYWMKRFQSYVI